MRNVAMVWSVRWAVLLLLLALSALPTRAAPHQDSVVCGTDPGPPEGSGAIVGVVFNDNNQNQIYEPPGEVGISNITVEVQTTDGEPLAGFPCITVSGGDGRFEFQRVPAGRGYRVTIRGYEAQGLTPTGGADRMVMMLADTQAEAAFGLTGVVGNATITPRPQDPTPEPTARSTPTTGPTFTALATAPPTISPTPSATVPPSSTAVPTQPTNTPTTPTATVPTSTATPTITATPTRTPTGTLFALTPIATYITTTPGVRVTVTPPRGPGGQVPAPVVPVIQPTAVTRLPRTGSGTPLLWALGFGTLMIGASLARRLFFHP